MCGGGSRPAVVQRDPKAEAEAAANEAAKKANAETASRRRSKQRSSLLTTGAQGVQGPAGTSLLATASGKDSLGS